ncbi:MAG TPA: two-component regulator propeller domain-containing protein, partial [Bacteroidales bacterium]|nr:two-component regulator propeller domain-containing protein [Bacteroidales bacterium]
MLRIFYHTIDFLFRKYLIGLICILLTGISFHTYSQQYRLREFPGGPAQPYVYSILQDNNGYLWIGTGNGLTRYDGFDFKTYTVADSLAGNFITCSFNDGDKLWFGHMNGKISCYSDNKFFSDTALNLKTAITDIEKSPKGEIWASSYSGGMKKLNRNSDNIQNTDIDKQITINTFKFITNHEILVGSDKGLLYCRLNESGKVDIIRKLAGIPETRISDIIQMKKNPGFYIATMNNGLFKLIAEGTQFKISRIGNSLPLKPNKIQHILEDNNADLWISTFGNGLLKLVHASTGEFNHIIYFNKSTDFSTNFVKTVYEDLEGDIWSGNYGTGLTKISGKPFSFYAFDKNIYGTSVHSVYVKDNYRWLGTNKGLLLTDRLTGKVLKFFSLTEGLPTDKVTAIFGDDQKILWIGTENHGIYRMNSDNEKILPYYIGKGILENSITSITAGMDNIWVGTKKGLCKIIKNSGEIYWYDMNKGGLPHNNVCHLFLDHTGRLWVTTNSNVLTYIKGDKIRKIEISSPKGTLSLGPVAVENDSIIWVGSNGNGVFKIKSDSIANITTKQGLLSDYCYSLVVDNSDYVWVGHRGGLSKIRTSDLFVKPVQQYAGIESTCIFNANAAFKDSSNTFSFGSSEGLWVYHPDYENKILAPPRLNITSIKINDVKVANSRKLMLPPGNYKLKIEYIGLSLKEPDLVKYQYQLEGYDPSPQVTKSRSVTYPHISNGKYTFMLWAVSGDGSVTRSPSTLNITIRLPLWKQGWFYILTFAVLAIIVFVVIKQREYNYLREKRKLEEKVNERTKEISEKNELLEIKQKKITSQNNELEQYRNYLEDLVEERTKELLEAKNKAEESDKLKTAFLNNLSHEIRTPLNAIYGFFDLIREGSLSKKAREGYIDVIHNNIDSLLFLFNEIIDLSLISAGQFKLVKEKFKVDTILKELEEHYIFDNNKRIEIKFVKASGNYDLELYNDKERFRQVFIKLLDNACKFTKSGSVIFGYETGAELAHFFVTDTGIGIEPSEIENIFNSFYKIEKDTENLYRGVGIGLTV